jgi:hypothetical protein
MKRSPGGSVGIVGSYGTGQAVEEQIKETEPRWLSRYSRELRDYLPQVTYEGWKRCPGGSVGMVRRYGTVCYRIGTGEGNGAKAAQSL